MSTMQAKTLHTLRMLAAAMIVTLGLASCASLPNQPGAYPPQTYYGGSAYYEYGFGDGYSPWGDGYGWGPGLGIGYYGPPIIVGGGQPAPGGPSPPFPPGGGMPPPPPGGGAPPPPSRPPPVFGPMHHGFMHACPHGKNQACP